MKKTGSTHPEKTNGFIYVLQHSLMQDVVRIGKSEEHPVKVAQYLSQNLSFPGEYSVFSSIECQNANSVESQVKKSIKRYQSVGEFYELAPQKALNIIKRDAMRIPVFVKTEIN